MMWFLQDSIVGLLIICDDGGSSCSLASFVATRNTEAHHLTRQQNADPVFALNFWVVMELVIRDWLLCSVEETELTEVAPTCTCGLLLGQLLNVTCKESQLLQDGINNHGHCR